MQTKIPHGVTLWAVPRFHRPDSTPGSVAAGTSLAPQTAESGTAWVDRLKTYSFPLAHDESVAQIPAPDQAQICH